MVRTAKSSASSFWTLAVVVRGPSGSHGLTRSRFEWRVHNPDTRSCRAQTPVVRIRPDECLGVEEDRRRAAARWQPPRNAARCTLAGMAGTAPVRRRATYADLLAVPDHLVAE